VKYDGRRKKESERGREMFEMKAKEKRGRGGGRCNLGTKGGGRLDQASLR
jgi:hypothetical protein